MVGQRSSTEPRLLVAVRRRRASLASMVGWREGRASIRYGIGPQHVESRRQVGMWQLGRAYNVRTCVGLARGVRLGTNDPVPFRQRADGSSPFSSGRSSGTAQLRPLRGFISVWPRNTRDRHYYVPPLQGRMDGLARRLLVASGQAAGQLGRQVLVVKMPRNCHVPSRYV